MLATIYMLLVIMERQGFRGCSVSRRCGSLTWQPWSGAGWTQRVPRRPSRRTAAPRSWPTSGSSMAAGALGSSTSQITPVSSTLPPSGGPLHPVFAGALSEDVSASRTTEVLAGSAPGVRQVPSVVDTAAEMHVSGLPFDVCSIGTGCMTLSSQSLLMTEGRIGCLEVASNNQPRSLQGYVWLQRVLQIFESALSMLSCLHAFNSQCCTAGGHR